MVCWRCLRNCFNHFRRCSFSKSRSYGKGRLMSSLRDVELIQSHHHLSQSLVDLGYFCSDKTLHEPIEVKNITCFRQARTLSSMARMCSDQILQYHVRLNHIILMSSDCQDEPFLGAACKKQDGVRPLNLNPRITCYLQLECGEYGIGNDTIICTSTEGEASFSSV